MASICSFCGTITRHVRAAWRVFVYWPTALIHEGQPAYGCFVIVVVVTHGLHMHVVLAVEQRGLVVLVQALHVVPRVERHAAGRRHAHVLAAAAHRLAVL